MDDVKTKKYKDKPSHHRLDKIFNLLWKNTDQ